jgi:hypothetical protein
MSQKIIDIGTSAGAGDGDDLRVAFDKVNQNFTEIYSGNVTAANVLVTSVAGRQGDVELTWLDVTGVASVGDITGVYQAIAANSAADRAYADSLVTSLGPISNVQITGGSISNTQITNSYGTLSNLTVTGDQTINGTLMVDGPSSFSNDLVVAGNLSVDQITFGDGTSMTTIVNLSPINTQIDGVRANVTAANASIAATNASIASTNSNVTALGVRVTSLEGNAGTQATQINTINSNVNVVRNNITSLQANAGSQAILINELRANITAANAVIASISGGSGPDITAANLEIDKLRANITAANSVITGNYVNLRANAAGQSAEINGLRANVNAANTAIVTANTGMKSYVDSAVSTLSISTSANAASQAVQINSLRANIAAANANIAGANLSVANVQIAEVRANVEAANAAIASVTATFTANAAAQAVQLNSLTSNAAAQAVSLASLSSNAITQAVQISSLQANVTAANAAIATKLSASDLQGNVTMGNVVAWHGNFTYVSGTLQTKAQPNITSVGNLTALNVDGNITADRVTASIGLYGLVRSPTQSFITQVGTLTQLVVTGNVDAGNVNGTTGSFTNLTGTLATAAQPNITSVGTLSQLSVTGNVSSGNVNLTGNLNAFRVNATGITGTLLTTNQTNISRVGTLVNLAVQGNTVVGNLTTTGTVVGTNIVGTLLTPSQPNITTIGNLTALNVDGALTVAGNINTPLDANLNVGNIAAGFIRANTVTALLVRGTLTTAVQPNITSVGTLVSVTTTGNVTAPNVVASSGVFAPTFTGNLVGATVNATGNINAGNVAASIFRAYGNIDGTVINLTTGISSPTFIGTTANVTNLIGTIKTNAQPFITSIGTLSGLTVNGPVEITGSQFVAQDFYVTGNLFVNGNTTTVSAGNVTTVDKDITLANGAVNSTAARGAGILIGQGGAFGNLTIYDGVWTTPNALTVSGNVITANVTGVQGEFTKVFGTIQTAAQPQITSVGTLDSVTTTGAVTAANITAAGGTIRDLNATTANVDVLYSATHVFAGGNVLGVVGEFTALTGSLRTALQPNITQVGTLGSLTVTGNVSTGNVSGTTGQFTNVQGTLLTAAQPNITSVGNLASVRVIGVATVGGLVIESGGAGSEFSVANITATANLTTSNLTVTGIANLVSFTGTVLNNVQPYITEVGSLTYLDVTGNITSGNVSGATGNFTNVVATGYVSANDVSATGNVSAVHGVFTDITGSLLTASQTNITTIGTLTGLTVTGATTVGNITANGITVHDLNTTNANVNVLHVGTDAFVTNAVSTNNGLFANVSGTLLTASQPNITTVGNLLGLAVTGNISTTENIIGATGQFGNVIGELYGNVYATTISGTTANINQLNGNVSGTTGSFANVTGTLQTASQPNITSIGNLAILNVTGNINAQAIRTTTTAQFTELEGNLLTNTQPHINTVGTLTSLSVTGNINTSNSVVVTGNVYTTGNVYADYIRAVNNIDAFDINVAGITTTGAVNIVDTAVPGATGNLTAVNVTATDTTQTANLVATGVSTFIGNVNAAEITITGNPVVTGSNITATSANLRTQSLQTGSMFGTNLVLSSTTTSTGPGTGALVVAGGIGANNISTAGQILASGNIGTAQNLLAQRSLYVSNSIYMYDARGTVTTIESNVANVSIFDSTVSNISIGGESTTVMLGAWGSNIGVYDPANVSYPNNTFVYGNSAYTYGAGNTIIRNSLQIVGNLFLAGGWGLTGIGNVEINNDVTVANNAFIANTMTSRSVSTANATISANLVTGDYIRVGNTFANAQSTSITTGALQVRGGAGIQNNLYIGLPTNSNANVYINSTARAFNTGANTLTGALQVEGGISTKSNLYVGGDAFIVGNVNFQAFLAASINGTPIGNATPSSGVFTTVGLSRSRPAIRPSFSWDFAQGQRIPESLTYARTGPATYFDGSGNLRVAVPYQPRFTYNPSTLTPLGIMIEESRQNVYRETNSFANTSVYATINSSVASGTSAMPVSPDGTTNVFKLQDTASLGTHGIGQQAPYVPTVSLGQTYTASVFAKRETIDQISLVFEGEGNDPSVFDLTSGNLQSQGASYGSSIETLANGWYRVSSTVTKTNTSGNVIIALASGGTTVYTGTGGGTAYIYGFQLEQGDHVTSYIPNTTVANTRGADTLSVTNTEFAKKYNVTESSVLVDAKLGYAQTSKVLDNRRSTLISFSDGTDANRVSVVAENRTSPAGFRSANLVIYTSGSIQTNTAISFTSANLTINSANASLSSPAGDKVAVYFKNGVIGRGWKANANIFAYSGNISSAINRIDIGAGPGTSALNGTVSKVQIWPKVVAGDELATLSINEAQGVS